MIYCRKELFDGYCKWLFDILNEIEIELHMKNIDYQPRLYGYLGERLFNVWVQHNKLKYKTQPIMYTDMNFCQRARWIGTTYISKIIFSMRKKFDALF